MSEKTNGQKDEKEKKKVYTLAEVQKKLESIGIFINLEILMQE